MGAPVVTLVVCDANEFMRVGIEHQLNKIGGVQIVGFAGTCSEAYDCARSLKPAVLLVDMDSPIMRGIELTRQVSSELPEVRVVAMSNSIDDTRVLGALSAGARGYCLKTIAGENLAAAVRGAASGAVWLDAAVADAVLIFNRPQQNSTAVAEETKEGHKVAFTTRELDVLSLLIVGHSNGRIAEKLSLSPETVKTHMRHVMEKLDVNDRTNAAIKAIQLGLVGGAPSPRNGRDLSAADNVQPAPFTENSTFEQPQKNMRLSIAEDPKTPLSVLKKLAQDEDGLIQDQAQKTMKVADLEINLVLEDFVAESGDNYKLGSLLVEAELLTESQLNELLRIAGEKKILLGHALARMNALPVETISSALILQSRLRRKEISESEMIATLKESRTEKVQCPGSSPSF
jgi:two-component system, NarL family, response regulator LiaR